MVRLVYNCTVYTNQVSLLAKWRGGESKREKERERKKWRTERERESEREIEKWREGGGVQGGRGYSNLPLRLPDLTLYLVV